jgi:hypothetical protein
VLLLRQHLQAHLGQFITFPLITKRQNKFNTKTSSEPDPRRNLRSTLPFAVEPVSCVAWQLLLQLWKQKGQLKSIEKKEKNKSCWKKRKREKKDREQQVADRIQLCQIVFSSLILFRKRLHLMLQSRDLSIFSLNFGGDLCSLYQEHDEQS